MKQFTSSISYKNHTPESSDGFYHKDCPVLYQTHDTITSLSDCPFPLKTRDFKVLLFGTIIDNKDSKYGINGKFVVVRYTKICGHTIEERIPFWENVQTFNHYGTIFEGSSYSINDWENRIERFRNYPCEICGLVKHSDWIYKEGLDEEKMSKKNHIKRLKRLLDYNYNNWSNFFDIDNYSRNLE